MYKVIHDGPDPLRPDFDADRKQLLDAYEQGEISAGEYCTQMEAIEQCSYDYYTRIGLVIDMPRIKNLKEKTMTTTSIIIGPQQTSINPHFRDSARLIEGFCLVYVDPETNQLRTPVECRVYVNNAHTVNYAAVWLRGEQFDYRHGFGRAGGGGYHRASAALWDAFTRTGITYEGIEPFAGRGFDPAIETFTELCRLAGLPHVHAVRYNP